MKSLPEKIGNFKLIAQKTGIESGGIYEFNNHSYLIKEMDLQSTINEYVGSHIARLIVGESAPEVTLHQEDGIVYTVSKFISGFKTFSDFVQEHHIPIECAGKNCVIDEDGSINIGRYSRGNLIAPLVSGLEGIAVAMELIRYDDPHFANRGMIHAHDNDMVAALVDYNKCLIPDKPRMEYIRMFSKADVLPSLELASSLNITEITTELFKEIYDAHQTRSLREIQNIEKNIIARLVETQMSLEADKNILQFTCNNLGNNESELFEIISKNFQNAGLYAKFELCSFIKKHTSFDDLFTQAKCENVKELLVDVVFSRSLEPLAIHVILNNKEDLTRVFDSYFSPEGIAAINSQSSFYPDPRHVRHFEDPMKKMVIFNRLDMIKHWLPKINENVEMDGNICFFVLCPILEEVAEYNRVLAAKEILPFFYKRCSEQPYFSDILEQHNLTKEVSMFDEQNPMDFSSI